MRRITIKLDSISDEDYADLASALWMLLRITIHDFTVTVDSKSDIAELNRAWDGYLQEQKWEDEL